MRPPCVMTRDPETSDQDDTPRPDVEGRILDDDRRRSGEFLRDYLSRHRVEKADEAAD